MKTWLRLLLCRIGVGCVLMVAAACRQGEAAIIYWPLCGLDVAKQRALGLNCLNNIREIRWAAQAWSLEHNDQFPSSLQLFTNYLTSPAVFFCPEDVSRPAVTNWADFDWGQNAYQWIPQPNWDDPLAICCRCRIHENEMRVDGLAEFNGRFRSGWPVVTAGPIYQTVTPGSDINLEVKIATNSLLPVTYQWRREQLYYVTNVTFVLDPDNPNGGYWRTNRLGRFAVTDLPGQTNATFQIKNVQTNDSDYYSVTVSNSMGATASSDTHLVVDPAVSVYATNDHWSAVNCLNNLKQIGLLGRIWSLGHEEHMPQNLSVMTNYLGSSLFGWPVVLFCRADGGRTEPPDWLGFNFGDTSYEVVAGDEQDPYAVFCRCKVHGFYVQMDGEAVSGPKFNGIRKVTNVATELEFKVFAEKTNFLEASADLISWQTLNSYSNTNGSFLHYDTNSLPSRFYRLRVQ